MALIVYNEAKYFLSTKQLNLRDDVLKAMLVTQGYIPDPNQKFVDDGTIISPNQFEVAGTGYVGGFGGSGRKLISNKSVIRDTETFRIRLFGDNVSWSPLAVGIVGGILVIREGTTSSDSDSNALLIGYTNEGGFPIPTDGGELQIRWNINGILAF